MKKNLSIFISSIAIICFMAYFVSCQKESVVLKEQPVAESSNDIVTTTSTDLTNTDETEVSDRSTQPATCTGSIRVVKTNPTQSFKWVVEVYEKCNANGTWNLVSTITCPNSSQQAVPISHERRQRFRMSFKNFNTCPSNSINGLLVARVELRNSNGTIILSKTGQNNIDNEWDIEAETPSNVYCPGYPIADSCLQ